jgi:hypothetical protein
MSATIGIQLITPTTGTPQGQAQQQANDNSAKAVAQAIADTVVTDAIKQTAPPQPSSYVTSQHVDRTA